jgi:hypothetical protein
MKKEELIEAVIEWENEISEWEDDEWEKELKKINKIKSKQDIVKYYLEWRGFGDEKYLMESLLYFIATID